ncbi:MAG: response regulator [Thermoanaerobaculaceae bacterium]|nr:response regulator [Thermoanaerobaculaceae bacterium]
MALNKILIVEDSELLHKMYDLILLRYKKIGVSVVHAYNGREGLEMIAHNPDIDLILLDINMPVMSGLEFLKYAKKEDLLREIPVVIISTEGKSEDTIRGLEQGAKAYITKPFQATDLYRIIEKVTFEKTPPPLGDLGGSSMRGLSSKR